MVGIVKAILVVGSIAFDDDGNPLEKPTTYGLSIPCKYVSANRNDVVNLGDGTFVQASYIITIKDMNFNAKQIQLIDSRGNIVCENDVRLLEVLETIKRIKIVV